MPRVVALPRRLVWPGRDSEGDAERSAVTLGPAELAGELEPLRRQVADRLDRRVYAGAYQRDVRRLCTAYVAECLREFAPGAEFAVDEIPSLLPRYHRAFQGLLRLLVADGAMSEHGDRYRRERTDESDPETLWAELFTRHPSCAWELLLLHRTGARLHDVLTGAVDPLELLFPAGSSAEAEPIYHTSPVARFYNVLAKHVLQRVAEAADRRRTLRVLEVGGGTGGLTASQLPALCEQQCEYVFTDVSPVFVAAARERFWDYDFVDYRVLDLVHDLQTQDFASGSFDVVVASDVVHATADAKKSLLYLQEMLAPGGLLLLIEAAPDTPWLDLTFGLTAGWWSFRDLRLRPDGPLLSAQEWQDLLRSLDFDDVAALGDPDHLGSGSQSILLARAPEAEPTGGPGGAAADGFGDWLILDGDDPLGAELAARIGAHGGRATLMSNRAERDLEALEPEGIIDLRGARGLPLERALTELSLGVIDLLQRVCRKESQHWPRLYVLTRGAHSFRNNEIDLSASAVWGLGAVVGLELPQLRYTAIDLDPTPGPGESDAVWAELRTDDNEREIALRAGERFVRRLVPRSSDPETIPARDLPPGTAFALTTEVPGSLDEVRYRVCKRVAPAAGEVEIEIAAAGVNFLDVMIALGQVPPLESAGGCRFGAECAGIVARVGAGVSGIAVGDAVVAVNAAQGTLASHLTVAATAVVAKPANLSFEEAAGLPIVS
ncbi:methyltransferase [Nocardia sp. NPDC049190]|uniref:methyltransferase n=1 Tax=Nocardia sp. NPDC049190 TaxID=3155650 RepID=UPI0033EB97E9